MKRYKLNKKKNNILKESIFGGGMIGGGFDNTLAPSSYSVQGQGPGYVYSILPMTDILQQKPNNCNTSFYIYPGCIVIGYTVNNPKQKITGYVISIIKNSNGEIEGVKVRDTKTNISNIILSPNNLHLISHTEHISQEGNHSFRPQNNLDFSSKDNGGMISGF